VPHALPARRAATSGAIAARACICAHTRRAPCPQIIEWLEKGLPAIIENAGGAIVKKSPPEGTIVVASAKDEREYKPLLERNSSYAQCNALMKRLSCAAYFPRCEPITGGKDAGLYGKTFGPCGSLCRAVKELDCPGSEHLDCTSRHCCENDQRICFNDDAGCTMCGSHFPPPPPPRGQTCAAHTTCNACIADDCAYTPAGCVPTCTDSSSACYTSASGCPATDLACAGYTNCAECARSGCAYQGARCRATCLVGRLSASLGGCCAASAEHCFPACEVPLPEPSPSPLPPQELADQLAEMFARGA